MWHRVLRFHGGRLLLLWILQMASIIKVFNSEANAITNDGTGEIEATTLSSKQLVRNNETAVPFFIYNKHYANI